jgi:MFS family permease
MLAVTLQGPMNGRVSDIVGRKPMLYTAILVFSIASALCGAAKTSSWYVFSCQAGLRWAQVARVARRLSRDGLYRARGK